MAFLAGRNNTARLRTIVLEAFIAAGEAARLDQTSTRLSSSKSTAQLDRMLTEHIQNIKGANPDLFPAEQTPDEAPVGGAPLTLQVIEKRLWHAANALRGPVDPADFKTYVFPMLFFKWLSDSWDYEHAQAVAEYGEDVEPEVEADYHKFALPKDTHWRDVTTKTDNLGSRIATALGRIEQANADSLAGIFGDAAWGNKERLPESSLVALIDASNGLALNPDQVSHDILGQAYEYLLKNFADESGKKAGEFFTPRQVVRLIVKMLDPQPGESIYDPAAGSGGMLVETINSVRANGGDTRTLRLYGQEVNLTTSAIARMNLFLHEIEDFKIVRGDTLRSPGLRRPDGTISQFDVVIANPPFSLENWGADLWAADARSFCGVPPAKNGDLAWVQHMLASMTEATGRIGVVMSTGALFRSGVEAQIRKCLVERDNLEAVVALPGNLFYSTTIQAAVLLFRAAKPASRRGHVLFVDGASRFEKARNQNLLRDEDLAAIVAGYKSGSGDAESGVLSRLVPVDEIEANDFDLHVRRYIVAEAAQGLAVSSALATYSVASESRRLAQDALLARLEWSGLTALENNNE